MPFQVVAIARDVTEREQAASELIWTATHDSLTGLANRTVRNDVLDAQVDLVKPFGLVLLDLDIPSRSATRPGTRRAMRCSPRSPSAWGRKSCPRP